MYQNSQIVSTTMRTLGQILGAIMDVILLPLMPLFVKMVEIIVPLIPEIQKLADAFFRPIVDFIVPRLQSVKEWVERIDWNALETWVAKAGETVAGWMRTIYNWWSVTAWPWLKDTAWPWVTGTLGPWISTVVQWLTSNIPTILSGITNWWSTTGHPTLITIGGYITTAYNWAITNIPTFFNAVVNWWDKTGYPLFKEIKGHITTAYNWVTQTLWPWLQNLFIELQEWFGDPVGKGFSEAAQALGLASESEADAYMDIREMNRDMTNTVKENVSAAMVEVVSHLGNFSPAQVGAVVARELGRGYQESMIPAEFVNKTLMDFNKQMLTQMFFGNDGVFKTALTTLMNEGIIPKMAGGGYVPNNTLAFLHAGETVVPAGGAIASIEMHNTFNIEIPTTGSVDELARDIEKKITDKLSTILRRQ